MSASNLQHVVQVLHNTQVPEHAVEASNIIIGVCYFQVGVHDDLSQDYLQQNPPFDGHEFGKMDGFLTILLQIIQDVQIEQNIRIAAAIQLKKNVKSRWTDSENYSNSSSQTQLIEDKESIPISQEEMLFVKNNILSVLAISIPVKALRNQLEDALAVVINMEYPKNWLELPNLLFSALLSESEEHILMALLSFRIFYKIQQFGLLATREALNEITMQLLPILNNLLHHVVEHQDTESEVMLLIIKIIRSMSTFDGLPLPLRQDLPLLDSLMMLLIHRVFESSPPPVLSATNSSDIQIQHVVTPEWWKVRHDLTCLFISLLNRYRRIAEGKCRISTPTEEQIQFAVYWLERYPTPFLTRCLEKLAAYSRNEHVATQKLLTVILDYLHNSIMVTYLWETVEPLWFDLFSSVFIPLLAFNDEDLNMLENDPTEYVLVENEPMANLNDPKLPTTQIIYEVVTHRKPDWFEQIISYLVLNIFTPYLQLQRQTPDRVTIQDVRKKYAALQVFGDLSRQVKRHQLLLQSIEDLLVTHVYPDMNQNRFPILQAKACWVYSRYCTIHYSDPQQCFNGLQALIQCFLYSPQLVVACEAGKSLVTLIPIPDLRSIISPLVMDLISKCLELLNVVENDSIVQTVRNLIRIFPNMVDKQSVNLMKELVKNFLKSYRLSNIPEDGEYQVTAKDGDASVSDYNDILANSALYTAVQTIKAMRTLYSVMRSRDKGQVRLEPHLIPVIELCLQEEGLIYIEEALFLLTQITYYSPTPFCPQLWSILPRLHAAFTNWASDRIEDMLPALDNFISRDKSTFLAPDTPHLGIILDMVKYGLSDPKFCEIETYVLTRVLEVLLLDCKGQIDQTIPTIIGWIVARIQMDASKPLNVVLLQVIINCFWYSTPLTVHILETHQYTQGLLQMVFDLLAQDAFSRISDKKCAILGLCSLLRQPYEQLPPYCQEHYQDMISVLIQVASKVQQQYEERRRKEEADENDNVDEDDEEIGLQDENDDNTLEYDNYSCDDVDDDSDVECASSFDEDDFNEDDITELIEQIQCEANGIPKSDPQGGLQVNEDTAEVGHLQKFDEDRAWSLEGLCESTELPTSDLSELEFLIETIESLPLKDKLFSSLGDTILQTYSQLAEIEANKKRVLCQ